MGVTARISSLALPQHVRLTRAALLSIVLLGVSLRMWHLDLASVWYDEIFTRYYPETGLRYMWTEGFRLETNPPLYFTLMDGWMRAFGHGAVALRLPSVIASVLTIPLVFALGRELADTTCGLLAALLFALAPMELYFAQEARSYALMGLPVALALLGSARFLRGSRDSLGLFCYILGAALTVYCHATGAFFAAACGSCIFVAVLASPGPQRGRHLRLWIAANAAVAALCLPELRAMLGQVGSNRLSWIAPTSFWDVRASLGTMVMGPAAFPERLVSVLALLLAAALALVLWQARPNRRMLAVVIAPPLLDFALLLVASLRQPMLLARILCWMWVPLAVVLSWALLSRVRARPVLIGVSVLVLGAGLLFQLSQDATAREPWRLFFTRLAPYMAQADIVVTGPRSPPTALAYYGQDMSHVRVWVENGPLADGALLLADRLGVRSIGRKELTSDIQGGRRVLLIQRAIESGFQKLLDPLPSPAARIQQRCWGLGNCLEAIYWSAEARPR